VHIHICSTYRGFAYDRRTDKPSHHSADVLVICARVFDNSMFASLVMFMKYTAEYCYFSLLWCTASCYTLAGAAWRVLLRCSVSTGAAVLIRLLYYTTSHYASFCCKRHTLLAAAAGISATMLLPLLGVEMPLSIEHWLQTFSSSDQSFSLCVINNFVHS
jgi:hypothetical protein